MENRETEVQARQIEIDIREKENEQLRIKNNQLIEQLVIDKIPPFFIFRLTFQTNRNDEIEEMKNKNEILQNEIKEINLNLQKTREEIGNYAKQSVINTFRRFD